MRLTINHTTTYTFSLPAAHLVQRLHLEPAPFDTQLVRHWTIDMPGIESALRFTDALGNITHLVSVPGPVERVTITSGGEVDVTDSAGIVRGLPDGIPHAIFLRQTALTRPDAAMIDFVSAFKSRPKAVDTAHAMMNAVHKKVVYETGRTHVETSAADAFTSGHGVCQDHAHILVGLARQIGIPARYVTGYLVTGTGASAEAAHAWAELRLPDLGWVGFDPANCQCPTDHYVRLACGLDSAAVTPVRGSRRGYSSEEEMTVAVSVEIAQQ
jgi:transglutaminase-like putative cysteine protease